jgi:tRNA 2-thiouridine synthesizing protein A
MADRKADATLDATGFPCPLPVLKTRKALVGLAPGAVLEVLADDPAAAQDFEAYCLVSGDRLLSRSTDRGVQRFLIEKAGEAEASSAPSTTLDPTRP